MELSLGRRYLTLLIDNLASHRGQLAAVPHVKIFYKWLLSSDNETNVAVSDEEQEEYEVPRFRHKINGDEQLRFIQYAAFHADVDAELLERNGLYN